jgi:hypothetical protein
MWVRWNLILVCFEPVIVLILMHGRCMVCAECTIGSEIILDTLMELQGDISYVESCYCLFGDSVSVGAR